MLFYQVHSIYLMNQMYIKTLYILTEDMTLTMNKTYSKMCQNNPQELVVTGKGKFSCPQFYLKVM